MAKVVPKGLLCYEGLFGTVLHCIPGGKGGRNDNRHDLHNIGGVDNKQLDDRVGSSRLQGKQQAEKQDGDWDQNIRDGICLSKKVYQIFGNFFQITFRSNSRQSQCQKKIKCLKCTFFFIKRTAHGARSSVRISSVARKKQNEKYNFTRRREWSVAVFFRSFRKGIETCFSEVTITKKLSSAGLTLG